VLKFRFVLVGLSLWLSLAQPGLCPCWMLADIEDNHPHPAGNAHEPHGHEYLQELFRANVASTAPQVISVLALMLACLAASLRHWLLSGEHLLSGFWFAEVLLPPPRLPL
jgi:hypothetical protein